MDRNSGPDFSLGCEPIPGDQRGAGGVAKKQHPDSAAEVAALVRALAVHGQSGHLPHRTTTGRLLCFFVPELSGLGRARHIGAPWLLAKTGRNHDAPDSLHVDCGKEPAVISCRDHPRSVEGKTSRLEIFGQGLGFLCLPIVSSNAETCISRPLDGG